MKKDTKQTIKLAKEMHINWLIILLTHALFRPTDIVLFARRDDKGFYSLGMIERKELQEGDIYAEKDTIYTIVLEKLLHLEYVEMNTTEKQRQNITKNKEISDYLLYHCLLSYLQEKPVYMLVAEKHYTISNEKQKRYVRLGALDCMSILIERIKND